MLFQLMKRLLRSAPAVRRTTTRLAYEAMSRFYRGNDVPFMNFGYAALDGDGKTLELAPEEEEDRYFIQLYHRTVAGSEERGPSTVPPRGRSPGSPLAGLDVLEVGCGRGGGAAWMARNLGPKMVVGTDVSPSAAAHANRRYRPDPPAEPNPPGGVHPGISNLRFVPGDAEALPFPDASFDVVVNVESSHCYGSMDRFMAEVARVLRPGGRFCFCDVRDTSQADVLRQSLGRGQQGMRLVEMEDITANVQASLDRTSARKEAALARFPFWVRGMFRDQTGVIGGVVHTAFSRGERVYLRALLKKQ